MEILKHRVNRVEDIDKRFGLEIDVKDHNNKLVLAHDNPTNASIELSEFLKFIKTKNLMAINIKTSEIENELDAIIKELNIQNYFTFDWSMPSLLKATKTKLVCAFRLSEYEKEIIPQCPWVWIDSFHSIWFDNTFLESLRGKGLKIAIVSPELHDRNNEIEKIKNFVNNGLVDAICTDFPEYWTK